MGQPPSVPRTFSGGPAAFVVDARGLVSAWSPAAERLLGYETAEVAGRPVAQLWPVIPWDAPQELSSAFEAGTPGPTAVLTHRQGHPVPVTLAAYPVTSVVPGSEGTVIPVTAVSLPTALMHLTTARLGSLARTYPRVAARV
ncbi:PAS domain S-box protein [Streptomyces mirabilis]|uniref:PAS domain S-box protein n=1 Tax=Streptomyces mirabilis TaxID=68239 RepID=UPI003654EE2E